VVAELCNIIYTHLPKNHSLRCEVRFTELLGRSMMPTEIAARARADIVVSEKVNGKREGAIPRWVIEVKRASASKGQVDTDLFRLAAVKREHPDITAWLVLVAEASRPDRFVTEEGASVSGRHDIPNTEQQYRVRRTFKAAHAFTRKERAQYACLVEVEAPRPGKTPR